MMEVINEEINIINNEGERALMMEDLIRATVGLKKAKERKTENEIQATDRDAEVETYEYRIRYLKKMLKGGEMNGGIKQINLGRETCS